MSGRLDGMVALISGAARGQGRSHAVRLAEEGARVIAFDGCRDIDSVPYPLARREDLFETIRLVEETGGEIFAQPADTRDRAAVQAVVAKGVERFGRLDIVVANAGIFAGAGENADTAAAWDDTIDVNLSGTFHTLDAAVPAIRAGGRGGSIVIVGSAGGIKATATHPSASSQGYFAYNASKTGLLGLMRSYALALAGEHIRVNSIHPTGVDTPMIQGNVVRDYFRDHAASSINRNAIPVPAIDVSDVSDTVAWLCSDASRYVTGAALPVDAGMMLL